MVASTTSAPHGDWFRAGLDGILDRYRRARAEERLDSSHPLWAHAKRLRADLEAMPIVRERPNVNVQHDREGLSYEVSYLADRAARARWEAEAYRSNLELQFWRTGTTPSAQRTASVLKDYGCRDEDIEVTAKSLALSALSVRKGAVINEATHVALGWLDEHVPRLRFKQR